MSVTLSIDAETLRRGRRRADALGSSVNQVIRNYLAEFAGVSTAEEDAAVDDMITAIELHRLSRLSLWDALIVHAARRAGANVLYSEDLQHGTVVGVVRVVNPFAA